MTNKGKNVVVKSIQTGRGSSGSHYLDSVPSSEFISQSVHKAIPLPSSDVLVKYRTEEIKTAKGLARWKQGLYPELVFEVNRGRSMHGIITEGTTGTTGTTDINEYKECKEAVMGRRMGNYLRSTEKKITPTSNENEFMTELLKHVSLKD